MLLVSLLLSACSPEATTPVASAGAPAAKASAVRDIDVATLQADLAAGKVPVLVDVRTPDEYARGHVAGAKLIPVSELQARLAELESFKDKPVYLICQSGGRSAAAGKILAEKGFTAVNVAGGTGAWIAAGYPVEK